ncbi:MULTISPECIES: RAMP superfamily CRISPR-associated protein [unclassified Microcoleus]|uniref:RAMP superfamily CRISPR-associated protein n=1 Tax=unclassified Microcoleus TaxID=2642155 RepID=UPI002FD6446D
MTELRHKSNRHIIKRIIVRGTLVLDTPTCLGSGDADSPTDLPLLRDSISNHALLTGSSIAGALRNYLRERNKGYQESDRRYDLAAKVFGDLFAYKDEKGKSEKEKIKLREQDSQSLLIIDDAIGTKPIKAELRDGVKINGATGTAEDKAKYDLELLQAGTEFPLSFELLVEREANEADLLKGLAIALSGLENHEISLGMKKRRGFGRCHVKEWQVWNFNLEDPDDRTAWLNFEHWRTDLLPDRTTYPSIATALEVSLENESDRRDRFVIHAQFQLVGSLLIRSGQDSTGRAPDVVHLKSHQPNSPNPESVLSGTSLAGVLRHRAERIVNTLGASSTLVKELFGFVEGKEAQSSRLVVREKVIENATDLVQTRIAIDRFTGGAYHGALFEEQPIFGGDKTLVTVELELRKPAKYEIGLLLLLLKDLWTSDLPVGGESSIGRGRLKGIKGDLIWHHPDNPQQWTIYEENDELKILDSLNPTQSEKSVRDKLEGFVKELWAHLEKEVEV